MASSKIVSEFLELSDVEKHYTLLKLLENTEIRQLKHVYEKVKQMLLFDCLTAVPAELAEKVLSYLDINSLCAATLCCRKWRDLTNNDCLWFSLCRRKGYVKFENLTATQLSQNLSPHRKAHAMHELSKMQICKWKMVYIKAKILKEHWIKGTYDMAPLLKGHRLQVVTIDCDNDLLVSGSSDNTSRVWNLNTLECLHVLEGHTDAVNSVAIKGDVIVTGCCDGVVRVYDTHSGQCLQLLLGHFGSVDQISFDGKTAISAGSDYSVRVWDVHTGKLLHTLTGHSEEIECVIFEDNLLALTGSWDCTLRVWDTNSGICKLILAGHTEVVYCCAFIPSETSPHLVVYSGSGDATIKSWNLLTGENELTLQGHTQEVLNIQCNEEIIASSSSDSTVRIWSISGICLHVLRGHIGVVRCLRLKDNDILISGGDRKRIIAWNVKTGEELYTVHKQQSLLHKMCITDTQIITASPDSPGTISVISFW